MAYAIRPATENEDDIEFIARAMLMGINPNIENFTGFLRWYYRTNFAEHKEGPYSYLNTEIVYDTENEQIVGALISMPSTEYREKGVLLDAIDKDALNWYADGQYYLDTVAVLKSYRKKGIGTNLINLACEKGKNLGFKEIVLSVEIDNSDAYDLYKKLGFVDTDMRWDSKGRKYQIMVKQL